MVADKTMQTRVSNACLYQGSLNPVMEGHCPIQRLVPILIKHSWTSQGPRTSKAGFDERHYFYCSQVRTGQL